MSFRLTAAALAADIPTAPQKLVLATLADMADESGKCWPSLEVIAKRSSMSRKGVIEQIPKLEAAGHLSVNRDGKHNVYHVHPVKPVTDSDLTSHLRLPVTDSDQSHTVTTTVTDSDHHQSPTVTQLVTDGDPNLSENLSMNQSSAPDLKPAASSSVAAPSLALEAEASTAEKPAKKPRKTRPIPDKPESLDQVTEYGQTLNPPLPDLESQKFMHYWEGENWRGRRGPMKDWKHSLRTWHLNWQAYRKTDAPSRPSKPSRTVTLPDGTVVAVRSQFAKSNSSY